MKTEPMNMRNPVGRPVCETCYDREDCDLKESRGSHMTSCEFYFPDIRADRSPARIATPEDKRKAMETREV